MGINISHYPDRTLTVSQKTKDDLIAEYRQALKKGGIALADPIWEKVRVITTREEQIEILESV